MKPVARIFKINVFLPNHLLDWEHVTVLSSPNNTFDYALCFTSFSTVLSLSLTLQHALMLQYALHYVILVVISVETFLFVCIVERPIIRKD